MKRLIVILLVVNAAVLFSNRWSKTEVVVHAAAGGGGVPAGNGDVNGDSRIDISDPVYLLSALFLGGPPPAAIECPTASVKGLPATGQTGCYDDIGNEIDCDSPGFPGQDGFYQSGCPVEGRFVDEGDGTVTDTCTGLMWQQDTAGRIDDWDPPRYSWQAALRYCADLDLGGHTDWRLPNLRELQSLVDLGRPGPTFSLAIDPLFERTYSSWYWSSSTLDFDRSTAWYVGFGGGTRPDGDAGIAGAGYQGKAKAFLVRAVRNAE